MSNKPIYVTEPHLPPLEEFIPYLEKIWHSKRITNNGPMHEQLEDALCEYLGVPEIALFNNGTTALLTALQALEITGEVITTPFSFVATAHALVWNGLKPIFVDISPDTFNIDPQKIEAAITPNTTAILPVHCYGHPCDVEAIYKIANKYNLKVIYDAAHAFGVEDEGGSILRHGNLSAISFHATKVFNTFEGGAVICPDKSTKQKITNLKNFGIIDETVIAAGINGKMSEINAAFGLLQLRYIDDAINKRREIHHCYKKGLKEIRGISILQPNVARKHNYSYFPVIVEDSFKISRDELHLRLEDDQIFTRKYFYPLITESSVYKETSYSTPTAETVSAKILCLPIHPDLETETVMEICGLIRDLS